MRNEAILQQFLQRFGIAEDDVVHWYDFVCPFCYVGQHRTQILKSAGLHVAGLPFRAHPDIPDGGRYVGPRHGPMYDMLDREAREAGLPLHWPDRLPSTRDALACAEWVREHTPQAFSAFQHNVFAAHFARGQDIGDPAILDRYASDAGVDVPAMRASLAEGSAFRTLEQSEQFGGAVGVQGTPAWLVGDQLISGLRPAEVFATIARSAK